MPDGHVRSKVGDRGLEPLELMVLLTDEASELVVRKPSSGWLFGRQGATHRINVWVKFSIRRASISRRIGIVGVGVPAVWVPAKIVKIAILGSRLGLKGLVKRLLSGILVMLVVKVVIRTSLGRDMLRSAGKMPGSVLQGRLK